MPIILQGNSGVAADVDGAGFRALKITPRPVDAGALGHYSLGAFTGILPAALAANSEIFQFRWADATRLCIINEVRISAAVSTTFFAAGVPLQVDLIKAVTWSVAGTGGTGINPATSMKKRTSMGSSLIPSGDIRIAAAAALGAGTKAFETNALAALAASCPITASLVGQIIAPGTVLL